MKLVIAQVTNYRLVPVVNQTIFCKNNELLCSLLDCSNGFCQVFDHQRRVLQRTNVLGQVLPIARLIAIAVRPDKSLNSALVHLSDELAKADRFLYLVLQKISNKDQSVAGFCCCFIEKMTFYVLTNWFYS